MAAASTTTTEASSFYLWSASKQEVAKMVGFLEYIGWSITELEAVYGIPTLLNLRVLLFLTFTLQSGTRTMEFHIESKYVFIFRDSF